MQKVSDAIGADATRAEVSELIHTLVSGKVAPSRILELHYWSLEPGALELLRNFLSLSRDNRTQLQAFFASADPESVSIEAVGPESLILSSTGIAGSRPAAREKVRTKL